GAKAYSIIEQGRVGMIVSSKAEDRRFLIEEAAGITKYKVKKKAAEKKMESTRQNLLRVSDVVAEIEKQLGSLRRQAQKAERYKQYKAEVRDIEMWSASQRWLGYHAEERVTEAALGEAGEAKDAAQLARRSGDADGELVRMRAEAAAADEGNAGQGEALLTADEEVRVFKQKLGAVQQQIEEAKQAIARAQAEIARGEAADRSHLRR